LSYTLGFDLFPTVLAVIWEYLLQQIVRQVFWLAPGNRHLPSRLPCRCPVAFSGLSDDGAHSSGTVQDSHLLPSWSVFLLKGGRFGRTSRVCTYDSCRLVAQRYGIFVNQPNFSLKTISSTVRMQEI